MSFFIFVEELLRILKMGLGFPRIISCGIAFPLDQISASLADFPMSHDGFYFELFFTLYYFRRWLEEVRTMFGCFCVRGKQ